MFVFAYGTLTYPPVAHTWEIDAIDCGVDTLDGWALESLAYLNAVPSVNGPPLAGVVWEVGTLRGFDALEGYPGFYDRRNVVLGSGRTAWLYTMQPMAREICAREQAFDALHTMARRGYEEHGISVQQIDDAVARMGRQP